MSSDDQDQFCNGLAECKHPPSSTYVQPNLGLASSTSLESDNRGQKRKQTQQSHKRKTKDQVQILRDLFAIATKPTMKQIEQVVEQTKLTQKEVLRWFRNQRHKEKKKKELLEMRMRNAEAAEAAEPITVNQELPAMQLSQYVHSMSSYQLAIHPNQALLLNHHDDEAGRETSSEFSDTSDALRYEKRRKLAEFNGGIRSLNLVPNQPGRLPWSSIQLSNPLQPVITQQIQQQASNLSPSLNDLLIQFPEGMQTQTVKTEPAHIVTSSSSFPSSSASFPPNQSAASNGAWDEIVSTFDLLQPKQPF